MGLERMGRAGMGYPLFPSIPFPSGDGNGRREDGMEGDGNGLHEVGTGGDGQ